MISMKHNRWIGLLCTVLSLAVILTCFPKLSLAEDSGISYYSVIENLQFEVDVQIVSSWDIHANLEFNVRNKGTETIHNWYITFDLPYQIEGIWNAEGYDADGSGIYTLKNNVWNQDILPGSTVNFGMKHLHRTRYWTVMEMASQITMKNRWVQTHSQNSQTTINWMMR